MITEATEDLGGLWKSNDIELISHKSIFTKGLRIKERYSLKYGFLLFLTILKNYWTTLMKLDFKLSVALFFVAILI